MKNLFIIISLLLLTSPVNGPETDVLYQYEASTGFASKGFEDDDTKSNYSGKLNNWEINAKIL